MTGAGTRPRARQLVVAHMDPYERTVGGTIRLRAVIGALLERGTVDLAVVNLTGFSGRAASARTPPDGVEMLGRIEPPRPLDGAAHALGSLARGMPRRLSREAVSTVSARLSPMLRGPYDLAWVHRQNVHAMVRDSLPTNVPVVLDADDVEVQRYADQVRDPRRPTRTRLLTTIDVLGWHLEGRRNARQGVVSVVSNRDDVGRLPGRVLHVPNPAPSPRTSTGAPAPRALFVGTMFHAPNRDGAMWLCREVWPLVRREIPDAVVEIVGRAGPSVHALESRDDGVIVTGEVGAVDPYMDRAGVVLVPLHDGSGTSIKTVQAFAARRPVVATRCGARGIAAPASLMAVADDPAGFAAAVVRRMRSWDREQIERAAAYHARHHTPAATARCVAAAVETALAAGHRASPR